MLRGSRDFDSRSDYAAYLDRLFCELNWPRRARFEEELVVLRALPRRRLDSCTRIQVKVSPGSTIRVQKNVYSVHSRLRGERVEVRIFPETVEVWYAQQCLERMPRLRGAGKHAIHYRHVIDWLVRKPGAFAHYRYRSDLFPTHRFRLAYDLLVAQHESQRVAVRTYLRLLHLAARSSEAAVEAALARLIGDQARLSLEAVEALVDVAPPDPVQAVKVTAVDLRRYDRLLPASTAPRDLSDASGAEVAA
jgi:hypothetical protein